jgi:hypothetical protein
MKEGRKEGEGRKMKEGKKVWEGREVGREEIWQGNTLKKDAIQ